MTNPVKQLWSNMDPRSDLYRHPLKVWPYQWNSLAWFAAAWAAMVGVVTVVGLIITNTIGEDEAVVNEWLEDRRTEQLDTLGNWSSVPSDTPVVIGILFLLAIAFPLVWKRWHDWAFLLGALGLEITVYLASNFLVNRPRPPVERMEEISTNSFPSGHMGAATALYIGFLIVARWHTVNRVVINTFAVVAGLIIITVGVSRLYLGVHYVSDLFAGIFVGAGSVASAMWIARRGLAEEVATADGIEPPQTADLEMHDER